MKPIKVHNPLPGGKSYCSPSRAAEYIARGRAAMGDDGELHFLTENQIRMQQIDYQERQMEEIARVNHGTGMFYWNGVFPGASFPPGCNVQFKRPDHNSRG